jgi:hypothetical protein
MQSAMEVSGGSYFIPCFAPLQFLKLSLYVKQPKFAPGMGGDLLPGMVDLSNDAPRLDAPESLIKDDIVSPPTGTGASSRIDFRVCELQLAGFLPGPLDMVVDAQPDH